MRPHLSTPARVLVGILAAAAAGCAGESTECAAPCEDAPPDASHPRDAGASFNDVAADAGREDGGSRADAGRDAALDGGPDCEVGDETCVPVLVLDELRAFPSAFGAGHDVSGGRGGEIYEVTTLADGGPGSYRDAISESNRIVIVKVEGIVDIGDAPIVQSGTDNLTIWGQFAPGNGLTISGNRHQLINSNNHVIRHITMQNKRAEGFGAFAFVTSEDGTHTNESGKGHYVDHCSFRFGMDQIFDLSSRLENERSTVAYNLIAEAVEGHNTGGLVGGGSTAKFPSGDITFARNMFYNVSHRHPNVNGDGGRIQHFNNLIVNWSSRLTRVNGAMQIDWFGNYADPGNHAKASSAPVNKYFYSASEWNGKTPSLYSAGNFIGGWNESSGPDQQDIWVWYKSSPGGCTSGCDVVGETEVIDNQPLDPSLFVSERQHDFLLPSEGFWSALDVPSKLLPTVGHNRGVRADGSPGVFRDDNDTRYVDKTASGETEQTYLTSAEWEDSSMSSTAMYSDRDGDHMPDWFEERHGHLDPDVADHEEVHLAWQFDGFRVENKAGYSNLEICAEFYGGGFDQLLPRD